MIHGLEIENNMDVTTTSFKWLTIYMKGGETATSQLSGPGGAAPWQDSFANIYIGSSGSGETSSCGSDVTSGVYCNGPNSISLDNGSVSMRLNFGLSSTLETSHSLKGMLWMREETPSSKLTTPEVLNYTHSEESIVDVVRLENGTIRQVRGEDGLLDLVPIDAFGYEIRLYASEHVTEWDGEQYQTDGEPHYLWRIYNPDRQPSNKHLRIEEHALGFGEDAPPIVHTYHWNDENQAWVLTKGGGLSQDRKQVTWNADQTQKTELQEILDPQTGKIARRIERVYIKPFPTDERLVLQSKTLDPGPNEERTTYGYVTDPQSKAYGKLAWTTYPDGNWKAWQYDAEGRIEREYAPWLDQEMSTNEKLTRVRHYRYEAPKGTIDTGYEPWRPRVEIESMLGHEISRTYHLIAEDQEWDIQCAEPGAKWNDPDNLTTKTTLLIGGPFAGEPQRIEHADGTITTNDYQNRDNQRIETVSHGIIADKGGNEPTEGTRTTTITGSVGQLYEIHTQDIATGLTVDRTLYSEHDPFHRPERIDYHDGTHERILHDCCGPSQVRDREGRWTNLVYDDLKRPVYEITDTETRMCQYNAAGDIVEIQRLNTQTRALETIETRQYDLKGKQILTDKQGRQQRALPTSNPRETITEKPDGTNRITLRARDGQLHSISGTSVHGVGYSHAVEKDGRHHVRTETVIHLDALGNDTREWVKTWYDALHRPYRTERADGAETRITYNQRGQTSSQTDPDGVTTLYSQNALGTQTDTAVDMNQNGKIDYKGTDRITCTERSTVEIEGIVYIQTCTYQWQTEKEDEPTLVSETLQSTDGLISQQTLFPTGIQWLSTTTWSENHPVNPADPAPAMTVKKQTTLHPDGTQTIQTYELTKLITEQRLGSDNKQISRVDYTYDDQNRLITQTDAYAGTTEYKYDGQGRRVAAVIQPAPEPESERPITRYIHDEMDRVIAIKHPDGTVTHSTYWPTGELKRTWGSRQYPVEHVYDYAGRKSTMTTWQDFENDTGKAVTQWIYNERNGNLVSKRYHDGKGPDYAYTQAGRLKQRIWARGEKTDYGYNNAGELIEIDYKDKNTPDVAYRYDRIGRKIETKQGKDYVQQMTYDDLARVVTETVNQPGVKEHVLTRSYNDEGKPSGFDWRKGDDNIQVGYSYDTSGRMSSVTDGELEVNYEYLANTGLIEHTGYLNQGQQTMRTTKTFDRLQRLLDTTTKRNRDAAILSSHAYQYNAANQRINVTDETGSKWNYRYDPLGQVTSGEQIQSDGERIQNYSYDYDWIGNRKRVLTQSHKDTKNKGREDYQTNLLNQYEVINSTEGDNVVQTVYQHDEDGNLIRDEKWSYEWNSENRLIAMESLEEITPQRLEFRYDPQGRRIRKEVFESEIENDKARKNLKWKLTKQHHYIYDGWNLIAELDEEGQLLRTHLWGIDLSKSLQGAGGIGGLLKTVSHLDNISAMPMYDGNGNIVQCFHIQAENKIARFTYDPFGKVLSDTADLEGSLPFRFSTKFTDDETDLYYYGYRYFNNGNGRWLSRDPINEHGGYNLFLFVNNAPTLFCDYLGMGVVDTIFNAALRRIDSLYDECEGLTGCIGVRSKCHTCCGSVSIVAASIMTAAFSAGHLACVAAEGWAALACWADLYDGFADGLNSLSDMDDDCKSDCP